MRPVSFRSPSVQPPPRPKSPFGDLPGLGRSETARMKPGAMDQFAELMTREVQNVNKMQNQADGMVESLLTGGDVNEAEVLTSVQKADLAFRMLLQVRNKLIEAYREIQQIQV